MSQPKSEPRARYLFGDATPFPLDENFIETLTALTDACVVLFRADVAAESRRVKAEAARKVAGEELSRLDALERWVNDAVRPALPANPKTATETESAAGRIVKSTEAVIKQSRASIGKKRDAAVRVALGYKLPNSVRDPIERFLLKYQLPNTRWSLHWKGGNRQQLASGEVRAAAPHGITAEFSTSLPHEGRWVGPMPVADFVRKLEIAIPRPNKPGDIIVPLHKYVVAEVEASPKREVLTVRKSAKKPSPGYHILMRGGRYATPVITPIDVNGEATGDSHAIEGESANQLASLWRRLLSGAPELVAARDVLMTLRLVDQTMDELESPADLAEGMLSTVAPLVREMRMRSRNGELVLRRDNGGRRDEIKVPREALQAKFSELPPRFARLFDALGLGLDVTTEYVSRGELPLKPAAPTTELEQQSLDSLDGFNNDTEPHEPIEVTSSDDKTIPRGRMPEKPPTSPGTDDPLAPVAGTIEPAA